MTTTDSSDTIALLGLRLPWKLTVAAVLSTLLVMADFYYQPSALFLPNDTFADRVHGGAIEDVAFYLVIPLLVIVLAFRERPADYGFTLGNWQAGLKWMLIAWAVSAPILLLAAHAPGMAGYYRRFDMPLMDLAATVALEMLSWEFLFRGFLLFALYRAVGPSAVVLQAVPFALAHLGKPPLESLSTIFGGMAFGWVAWRTQSFLYPFLIHWFVMMCVAVVASRLAGG